MELPHQSSNTCRLAWPWNWGAEVGHHELLCPSPGSLPCSANLGHGPRHWSACESKGRCCCNGLVCRRHGSRPVSRLLSGAVTGDILNCDNAQDISVKWLEFTPFCSIKEVFNQRAVL